MNRANAIKDILGEKPRGFNRWQAIVNAASKKSKYKKPALIDVVASAQNDSNLQTNVYEVHFWHS